MNFHPPFSEPPSFFFFSYPSNIEIFDFSEINITKLHPPIQNPGSAPGAGQEIKVRGVAGEKGTGNGRF